MRKYVRDGLMIVVGVLIMTVSYNMFLIPAQIAPGGVSGIATILYYLAGLPVGAISLAINLPLFLLGLKQGGRAFIIKTLISTALLSLFLDVIKLPRLTEDMLLSISFGGVLLGMGLGMVVLADATTGGTDLAAMMLTRKFKSLSMAWVLFALDMAVIIAAMFAFSPEQGLYSLITIYVSTKMMNLMLEGMNSARAFTVMSNKADQIALVVMRDMQRGVTCWDGIGMYSGKPVRVLYSVVSSRELLRFKHIISAIDPNAFVIVSEVYEVGGEGFTYGVPENIPIIPFGIAPQPAPIVPPTPPTQPINTQPVPPVPPENG